MKKLVVLMLMVSFASMASATVALLGPTTMDAGGDTITVFIFGNAEEYSGSVFIDYDTYGIGYSGTGPWSFSNLAESNPTGIPPLSPSFIELIYGGIAFGSFNVTGDPVAAGNWFRFDLNLASGQSTYAVDDTVDLDIYGSDYTTKLTGGYTITIVPEPMSIALLGLGGLLLRRHR